MHELSITENLLELALRHAAEAGASRIVRLNLVIGELSSVVDRSVAFYWKIVAEGSLAEEAELCFERVAARLRCSDCQEEFPIAGSDFACPACDGFRVVTCAGTEFLLESIEVECSEDDQVPASGAAAAEEVP